MSKMPKNPSRPQTFPEVFALPHGDVEAARDAILASRGDLREAQTIIEYKGVYNPRAALRVARRIMREDPGFC